MLVSRSIPDPIPMEDANDLLQMALRANLIPASDEWVDELVQARELEKLNFI